MSKSPKKETTLKVTCLQENLNKGLNIVSRAANNNLSLPILNNILLIANQQGILKLIATNLEIAIQTSIRSKVEQMGSITIPAQLLTNFISLLTEGNVNLQTNKQDEIIIKTKEQAAKIKGITANDFPIIPQIKKENKYICLTTDLKNALQRVIFASAINNTRPEINGILCNFNTTNHRLILTATDSYRLVEKQIPLSKSTNKENIQLIIPARSIQELIRLITEQDNKQEIEIFPSENQILFSFNQIEFISRTISGEYPDYQQIVPKKFSTTATVDIASIVRYIKTAGLFSRGEINDINLEFIPQHDKIIISSSASQIGQNQSEIPAKIEGEKNMVTFNYRYLLDSLNNLADDQAIIKMIDNNNPVMICPKKEQRYFSIIMPIKQ